MVCNITDFNAIPGEKLCTREIQNAIDACFASGGGEVVIPKGDFVAAGLRLRSNVTLHLLEDAHLIGSIDPGDYFAYLDDEVEPIPTEVRGMLTPTAFPECPSRSAHPYDSWNNAIIRVISAENVAIIGERGSLIDGRNCFDEKGEERYRGPHPINIWFAKDVTLEGYTVKDSGNWAHAIQNSQNITCRRVTVLGGHDGFDVRTCDNVTVEDCIFRTGDDCIAGFDNINVTVRRCIFDTACSILRFGGRNVLVEDCQGVAPSTYGFRGSLSQEKKRERADTDDSCRHNCLTVFLYYSDRRAVIREPAGAVKFKNCKFKNADGIIDIPYGHVWCCNGSVEDVTFENCVFDGIVKPCTLTPPADEPLSLQFKDCKISTADSFGDFPIIDSKNMKNIVFDNVRLENSDTFVVRCNSDCNISTANTNGIKVIGI